MYADAIGDYSHAEGKGITTFLSTVLAVSTEGKTTQYTLNSITTSADYQSFILQVGDIVCNGSNYAKVTAIISDSDNKNYIITTDK